VNLPPDFISTITNTFGKAGENLITNLPALIDEASARWNLTNVELVPNLSYNFVAFADSSLPTGEDDSRDRVRANVVLKMGVPNREFKSEMAALKLFNGEGACRLLEYDEEKYWMLLERLRPGVMLSTLRNDEEATRIGAEVMKKIWKNLDSGNLLPSIHQQADGFQNFIRLTDWFLGGFERLRKTFNGGTGPIDEKLVERVEHSVKDYFAENHNPVLMHGDFHHYNVLSSERGWLIIDPKGVIGPAGYEVGPFMLNPWGSFSDGISRQLILRRVDIFHEHLGFERERIIEWSLAHAVLSTWWSIEDNTGWEYALDCVRLFAELH